MKEDRPQHDQGVFFIVRLNLPNGEDRLFPAKVSDHLALPSLEDLAQHENELALQLHKSHLWFLEQADKCHTLQGHRVDQILGKQLANQCRSGYDEYQLRESQKQQF